MINVANKDGNTVLHIACLKGNIFLINNLYNLGSNISSINNKKETILHCAIKSGRYDINSVYLLLITVVGLNCQDYKGRNALHIAVICKNKNIDVIDFLIKNGSDIINPSENNTIMTNLEKLEKNYLNIQIKTLLIHSFYNIYKQKSYKDGNLDSQFEQRFYDLNVDKTDECYRKSIDKDKNYINLYSYKLCKYPEYSSFVIKSNKVKNYNVINKYNVKYDKDDDNLLKQKNPIPKKVLPIKYKKHFETFQNISDEKPLNNSFNSKMSKNIISLCFMVFLIIFLFIYE